MTGDEPGAPLETRGVFVPFILLAVSMVLFLVWQITNILNQRAGLQTAKAQAEEAIRTREPQVAQAVQINNRFEALAIDLLELARTNENAQAIVKKHDIQRAAPPK